MTKKQAIIINVLVISVLALGMAVSRQLWFRADLTRDRLFTISEVSRNLHHEISSYVQITYYISDRLRAIHPIPGEIEDMLRVYAAFSRGRIRVVSRDPVRANLVREVEQLGILPQQVPVVERDQTSVMTVYSGIVIEYLDQIEVLPIVFSLETLEYDLTSRIRSMVRGRTREVGIIFTGHDPRIWSEDFRFLQTALWQAGYTFRMIFPGDEIPETLPVIMVLGGAETLDEIALFQIDRYIQTGGRVFFAVKSTYIDRENLNARALWDNGLLEMIASYGVTILPEIAMDVTALPMWYQSPTPIGMMQRRILNPQWIRVLSEYGNRMHPVTARFGGIDLFYANPLVLNPPEGVEAEFLFTSTEDAWSMREPFITNPHRVFDMERDAFLTSGRKILGASLSGVFPSWFEGRPEPSSWDGQTLPQRPDEARPSRIVVIGETDFISSFIGLSDGGQQSLNFIIQAIDWLNNEDDILGIRSRQTTSGMLDRIFHPERRAAAILTVQIINLGLMPLLVIVGGITYNITRKAKAKGVPK